MEENEYEAMARLESTLWWYRVLHEKVLCSLGGVLDPRKPAALLDAGCGTGGLLKRLESALPIWSLHGIDASEHAISYARNASRANLTLGSVMDLPYATASFDVIVSLDVMYHRQVDPPCMLAECARVLRPGGILILNLPAYAWLHSYHDEHVQTARRYTLGSLAAVMRGHPFRRCYGSYWNAVLFLPLVIKRKLLLVGQESSDVTELPRWLNTLLYAIARCEIPFICHRLRIPFGSSVFAIYEKTVVP